MPKLISIITVVYNRKADLEKTLKNLVAQKSPQVELVVIDGGSTDGTKEVILSFGDDIDSSISEPDKGVFDAMNKGIKLATGKWLIFINAGDGLLPGVLNEIEFEKYEDHALVYGSTIRENGKVDRPYELKKIESGSMPACHQSMFYNADLLGSELYYNTLYPLFGENELMMRIYRSKQKMAFLDQTISRFQGGGISSRVDNQVRKARYRFLWVHFGVAGIAKGIGHKLGLVKYAKV